MMKKYTWTIEKILETQTVGLDRAQAARVLAGETVHLSRGRQVWLDTSLCEIDPGALPGLELRVVSLDGRADHPRQICRMEDRD